MSKLIQIKNGDFVRSDTINGIVILDFVPISDYQNYEIKDRVRIDHGVSNYSLIEFDTPEECKTYAEELVALINEDTK